MEKKKPRKILFVCLGNICRSPAAEGVMKSVIERLASNPEEWMIDSAGTGRYHIGDLPDERMRKAARKRGLNLNHICRQVRESDFDDFDLIIGMDASNITNLMRVAPTVKAMEKIQPMSKWLNPSWNYDYVPDPYYEGPEGFELVLDLLEDACSNLYESLI